MTELEDLKRIKYVPKRKLLEQQKFVDIFGCIIAFAAACLFIYALFFA